MYTYNDYYTVFQFNVPESQGDKLDDVRYTIYEIISQSGGDVTLIYQSETDENITKTNGAYQVRLSLPVGSYSINWKILNTPYIGNEEINVSDKISNIERNSSRYAGYGL